MSDFEPSAPTSSTPTLYLSERVHGWWPGVSRRCSACSPAGLLRLDEPEGKYPGSLVCMTCAREPFVVRQDKPAAILRPPVADGTECVDGCGRAAYNPGERFRDSRKGRCSTCHPRWKSRQNMIMYRNQAAEATPAKERPPCIVCGKATPLGQSSKYCSTHLSQKKRGVLGLTLRQGGAS